MCRAGCFLRVSEASGARSDGELGGLVELVVVVAKHPRRGRPRQDPREGNIGPGCSTR
jgi:hypothetical protein